MCSNIVSLYLALAVIILMSILWDFVWENPNRGEFDRHDKETYIFAIALAFVPGIQFVTIYFILSSFWRYLSGKH